jgi:hypothetical protein
MTGCWLFDPNQLTTLVPMLQEVVPSVNASSPFAAVTFWMLVMSPTMTSGPMPVAHAELPGWIEKVPVNVAVLFQAPIWMR